MLQLQVQKGPHDVDEENIKMRCLATKKKMTEIMKGEEEEEGDMRGVEGGEEEDFVDFVISFILITLVMVKQ